MIRSTMQRVPLSVNQILERAGRLYPESEIVTRLPDKSLARHRFADFHRRARALASALLGAGLRGGDRVATLCWNHYAHLECYFGIPAAGGVMHTLNLRLSNPGTIDQCRYRTECPLDGREECGNIGRIRHICTHGDTLASVVPDVFDDRLCAGFVRDIVHPDVPSAL